MHKNPQFINDISKIYLLLLLIIFIKTVLLVSTSDTWRKDLAQNSWNILYRETWISKRMKHSTTFLTRNRCVRKVRISTAIRKRSRRPETGAAGSSHWRLYISSNVNWCFAEIMGIKCERDNSRDISSLGETVKHHQWINHIVLCRIVSFEIPTFSNSVAFQVGQGKQFLLNC